MRVKDLFEGDVVQFPNRKHDVFVDKLKGLAAEMPAKFAEQDEAEAYVKDQIYQLEQKSESRKAKYRHPSIIRDYRKGINPFEALEYVLHDAIEDQPINHALSDDEKKFVVNFTREHIDDIIRILKHDIQQLREFRKYVSEKFKTIPAPGYVTVAPFQYKLPALTNSLEYFEQVKKRL